jgi:hypothetical protein
MVASTITLHGKLETNELNCAFALVRSRYVREARRMVSDYVFTMHDRVNDTAKVDSV